MRVALGASLRLRLRDRGSNGEGGTPHQAWSVIPSLAREIDSKDAPVYLVQPDARATSGGT